MYWILKCIYARRTIVVLHCKSVPCLMSSTVVYPFHVTNSTCIKPNAILYLYSFLPKTEEAQRDEIYSGVVVTP